MKSIKVFIADDSTIVREQFAEYLSRINNMNIIGQADNGNELLKLISKLHPDVVLLGYCLSYLNGKDIVTKIKLLCPDLKIIIFNCILTSGFEDDCLKRGIDYFFQSESNNSLFDFLKIMSRILYEFRNVNNERKYKSIKTKQVLDIYQLSLNNTAE